MCNCVADVEGKVKFYMVDYKFVNYSNVGF
jgi:hypothetical protein